MKILHHIDADGHCAAAIVLFSFENPFRPTKINDLIPYNYKGEIDYDYDDIKMHDDVFIVDISLNDDVFKFIKEAYARSQKKIVHIDHHATTLSFLENMNEADKEFYKKNVIMFHSTEHSGSLLTWVYSFMNDEQRDDPMNVKFDFTEDYANFAFMDDNDKPLGGVPYTIPLALRYIDDYDIWKHQFPESKLFQMAYNAIDNHPMNQSLWNELLYNTTNRVGDMIDMGQILSDYQNKQNKRIVRNAYEIEFHGFKGLVVNNPGGGSLLFGDLVKDYDFVGTYNYDGVNKIWMYSMYSHDTSPCVCGEICKKYLNGGGHPHAAGGHLDNLIW